jgi:hypothetical protein
MQAGQWRGGIWRPTTGAPVEVRPTVRAHADGLGSAAAAAGDLLGRRDRDAGQQLHQAQQKQH